MPAVNLAPRILANALFFLAVFALAVPVGAEGGITIAGTEIPWGVISVIIQAFVAVVALLLRSSMATMKVEFNHQMTEALKATLEKGHAAGVLQEKERAADENAARAAGVAEEKGRTPPATPLTGGSS